MDLVLSAVVDTSYVFNFFNVTVYIVYFFLREFNWISPLTNWYISFGFSDFLALMGLWLCIISCPLDVDAAI